MIAAYLDGENCCSWRALQHAFWEEAKDIGQPNVRRAVADAAGFNGAYLLSREQDEDVLRKWRNDREIAVEKGTDFQPTSMKMKFIGDRTIWASLSSHLRGEIP